MKVIGTCSSPGCEVALEWRGSGRRPKFCPEHRANKFAIRRSRELAKVTGGRPQCCIQADGTQLKCPQHKEDPVPFYQVNHYQDYAGRHPKPTHRVKSAVFDDAMRNGLAVKGHDAATRQPVPLDRTDRPDLRVIGQRDLTADWQPVDASWQRDFGQSLGPRVERRYYKDDWTTLVPRAADWPFADLLALEVAA